MAEKKTLRNAKGEGSFKVNADGTVTHRKSVGFKANGRRKVITVTAKNKSACIREMRKKEAEWNNIKNGLHIGSTGYGRKLMLSPFAIPGVKQRFKGEIHRPQRVYD